MDFFAHVLLQNFYEALMKGETVDKDRYGIPPRILFGATGRQITEGNSICHKNLSSLKKAPTKSSLKKARDMPGVAVDYLKNSPFATALTKIRE